MVLHKGLGEKKNTQADVDYGFGPFGILSIDVHDYRVYYIYFSSGTDTKTINGSDISTCRPLIMEFRCWSALVNLLW